MRDKRHSKSPNKQANLGQSLGSTVTKTLEDPWRLKRGWGEALRGLSYAVVLLGGLWIGYGLLRYGTATPCGMLAEEMNSRTARRATQSRGRGQERAIETLAARIAAGFAAERARLQGPLKCTQALWRIKVEGAEPFKELEDLESH